MKEQLLTTVPIATTPSYLPLLAIAFAIIGSSKLPGTQTTYFTAFKQYSQTLDAHHIFTVVSRQRLTNGFVQPSTHIYAVPVATMPVKGF